MIRTKDRVIIWDDIVMMLLALVSAYILIIESGETLALGQALLLDKIDLAIALIFLTEFFVKLFFAQSKSKFLKSNWWYLLASIPITTPATQLLRLLRLLRLSRLIRISVGARESTNYFERFAEKTHLIQILTIWFIVVLSATISFFSFEHQINPHVLTLFDSFWWVMSTVTTVGYGDITPMTISGRIVGMLLMITGIGTTGIFTAFVATFLIKEKSKKD